MAEEQHAAGLVGSVQARPAHRYGRIAPRASSQATRIVSPLDADRK
jgi:hypothetical protein